MLFETARFHVVYLALSYCLLSCVKQALTNSRGIYLPDWSIPSSSCFIPTQWLSVVSGFDSSCRKKVSLIDTIGYHHLVALMFVSPFV